MKTFHNSVASEVRSRIEKGRTRKMWTPKDFSDLPTRPVSIALSRLTSEGTIKRVHKGIYYKPQYTKYGPISPTALQVSKAVLKKKGARWTLSGLAAYNKLGLTTQASAKPALATNRFIQNEMSHLQLMRRPVAGRSWQERAVLDALREINRIPGSTKEEILEGVKGLISNDIVSFERLINFAPKEPPRVRALIGLLGTLLRKPKEQLRSLKSTINPTTTFKLGLGNVKGADRWQIK